jgi:hypothetical protein
VEIRAGNAKFVNILLRSFFIPLIYQTLDATNGHFIAVRWFRRDTLDNNLNRALVLVVEINHGDGFALVV